jgi:cytochrome c biogenesis protein ResB
MTTIQLHYVPIWKEDAEYAHMSDVWQDMTRFKSNVDILAAGLEMNPNSRIVLNSPVQLGGADVPFIGGMKTGGTLAVNNDISGMWIVVNTDTGNNKNIDLSSTGSVSYHPTNIHYVDETYCYENGALIVARDNRSMMKLSPGIVLENGTGISSVNLSVRAVTLDGKGGVMASNSIEDIRLTSHDFENPYDSDDVYISGNETLKDNVTSVNLTIYTENTEAWEKYFEDLARESTLQKGTDYDLSTDPHMVTFSLPPKNNRTINFKAYNAWIKIESGI